MELPRIDRRTKEDLLRYIKKYLSSYTPEWRFDEDNPDIGTALAYIYAEMMSETIYRFNQAAEKNRVMFFSKIGARLLPAVPAGGYVTFSLVNNEAQGVEVKQGEAVAADTPDGESLTFETLQDVYVTPVTPDCLYLCCREQDLITSLFEDGGSSQLEDCPLFSLQGVNLQKHELYFSHPSVLYILHEAWIYCCFHDSSGRPMEPALLKAFLDRQNVIFEYYSSEGFQPFQGQEIIQGQIALKKGVQQPPFALWEHDGVESYWIRCRVLDAEPFEAFFMGTMTMRSIGREIIPDTVNAGGVDQRVREFFPFGERPALYDEVYFISDEVVRKKGAMITLDFDLEFMKFPLETQEISQEVDWKAIMKRSEFKVDMEYDISIAEVIWEYFNGDGFARLFVNHQYSQVFGVQDGTAYRRVSLHFRCPRDLEPVLVNSSNACCIRARVLKINNLYKLKGDYISPLVSNPRLRYEYLFEGLTPEYFSAVNNLDQISFPQYSLKQNGAEFCMLEGVRDEVPSLYLGFEAPPLGGPIKMLFSMEENMSVSMPLLQFEYSGKRGWKNLNAIDETENFRKTGIITMIGSPDFEKRRLLGKERYWIRIRDTDSGYYRQRDTIRPQRLLGIYMNTTPVSAVETREPELFTISPGGNPIECRLREGQIHQLHVWVNEFRTIRRDEVDSLAKSHRVRCEYSSDGEPEAVWVEWKEVPQLEGTGPNDRCYCADKIAGVVTFPDGRNGKLPNWGPGPTVRIEYSCGGGKAGNLPRHMLRRLNRGIGFISGVDNHEITTGGCDQEQIQEALKRSAAALRHGYRAVTASDYEDLALEADRSICRAKCFPNRNEDGSRDCGHVTLVVLQTDYENGRKYFDVVRTRIMNYMKERISPQLSEQNRFHIIEPDFLELSVSVTLQAEEYSQVFEIRSSVEKRLSEFLNPITGNYQGAGWEIGSVPNTAQILNALKDIPGIYYIENVRFTAYQQGRQGRTEIDIYNNKASSPYTLPVSGSHEIVIKMKD